MDRPDPRPPRDGTVAFDGLLLGAVLALTAVGAVMVYSASAIPAGIACEWSATM